MEGYEHFKQELNRMPTDRRSSQNTTNPGDARTPTTVCRREASNQRHVNSPYPFPQDNTRTQLNDVGIQARQRHEAPRQHPGAERSDFLACQADVNAQTRNNRPLSLNKVRKGCVESFARRAEEAPFENRDNRGQPLNLNDSSRASGITAPQPVRCMPGSETRRNEGKGRRKDIQFGPHGTTDYNTSGRPLNLSEFVKSESSARPPERFNTSGRPFNLSEFATRPVAPQRHTPENYNAFGRPFNLSEFAGKVSRLQERTPSNFGRMAEDQCQTEFAENQPSPRPTKKSSEFATKLIVPQRQIPESHNGPGRPLNLSKIAGKRSRSQERVFEASNASRRTLNLSQHVPQHQSPNSYIDSGRPLNLPKFGLSRSKSLGRGSEQDNASGRPLKLSEFTPAEPIRPQIDSNLSEIPSIRPGQSYPDSLTRSDHPGNILNFSGNRSEAVQRSGASQFPSADRSMSGNQTASRKVDSGTRSSQANKTSLITTHPRDSFFSQKDCAKDPVFLDRSGREFSRGISTFDSGFGSRQQTSERSHKLPEDKLFRFLHNDDTKRAPPKRHPLFNTLVKDTYYPGAIDDAVNGKIDFNAIAFSKTFNNKPAPDDLEAEKVPISLLQAFEERLNYEDDLRECLKRRREFCLKEVAKNIEPESESKLPSAKEDSTVAPSEPTQGQTKFWTHRDELKLASTVDVDLATSYRDQPETDLTTALTCLAKAEKMNNFDMCVHKAEEAIRKRKGEEPEKAALKSSCSFHIDIQKDETNAQKTYHPIEIISYVGTTKPRDE